MRHGQPQHHDQQGSTRLLTGPTGNSEATFTYDAHGNRTGSTGTSNTPMGYDRQCTNADTGLIYLRARYYDLRAALVLPPSPATSRVKSSDGLPDSRGPAG